MRKYFTCLLLLVAVILAPIMAVKAETSNVAKIGTTEYATLEEAISKASANDTITLLRDANMTISQSINKNLTLNLNGHNVTAPSKTFSIENATFTIEGKGMVSEVTADYAPIYVKGSTDRNASNYTVVNIGSDVTLRGWSGIFIAQNSDNSGYGIVVNFKGTIANKNVGDENYNFADASGKTGAAIYVNGSLFSVGKSQYDVIGNVPQIHISGATIHSIVTPIYAAGYANWTIDHSVLTGVESAIGAKAGTFVINNSELVVDGESIIPPLDNNNGIEPSGAVLQLESNSGYAGEIEVTVNNSTLTSHKGVVLCEYLAEDTFNTSVKKLNLNGGTYTSNDSKHGMFAVSSLFDLDVPNFVTAGTFNKEVTKYVAAGSNTVVNNEGKYVVSKVEVPEGKFTIRGKIKDASNNEIIQLKQGGKVLKITNINYEDGSYSFANIAPGVYNVVAMTIDFSTMAFVEIVDQDVVVDLTMGTGTTNVTIGQGTPSVVVEGLETIDKDKDISLEITKNTSKEEQTIIQKKVSNKSFDFLNISLFIEDADTKEIGNVLKIVVPYQVSGKTNITLSRYHNGEVNKFNKLNTLPTKDYEDGTYYIDTKNNLMYIFTSKFSTYAIGYDEVTTSVNNPETGDGILTYVAVILASLVALVFIGVSLKKRKLNNEF